MKGGRILSAFILKGHSEVNIAKAGARNATRILRERVFKGSMIYIRKLYIISHFKTSEGKNI